MNMRIRIVFLILPALVGFAPAPPPRPPRPNDPKQFIERLQGTWQITSAFRGTGTGMRLTASATTRIHISGNTWIVQTPGRQDDARRSIRYTIALDLSRTPAEMTLFRETTQTPWMKGVVTLDGDTLKWCYVIGRQVDTTARPARFDPIPDGAILMTLKRDKPDIRGAKR